MKRQAFIQLALSALALCAAAGAQAQATRLRFAHAGPETASQHLAALEFARLAKERSKGQLEVLAYPSSQLGNDATVLGALRGSTINILMAGSGNFGGPSSRLDVLDILFLLPAHAHAHAHAYTNRAVNKSDEIKGLKLRTTPKPTHLQAWRLLGANPVPIPLGEQYQALKSGAVDAQEHPVDITYKAKSYEGQKHLTTSRHAFTAMPLVMNKKKFDGLGGAQQQVLLGFAQDAKLFQRQTNQKNGMTVIDTFDPSPFRAFVGEPMRQSVVAKNGPELLNAVDAIT